MLQKSGRLVLWEAMFILELHSAETQGYHTDYQSIQNRLSTYYYTFIVFANDVSNAVISGFPSTFISSSASTPSGTVIVLLPSS